jgi:DNA-binding XRE family transcriptional regulator
MTREQTGAERYLADRMADPAYREAYQVARLRIDAIDDVMRTLDDAREAMNLTKAELARRAGIRPGAVRRLFSAERPNPTLDTLIALAEVLELEIVPSPRKRRRATTTAPSGASRTPQRAS